MIAKKMLGHSKLCVKHSKLCVSKPIGQALASRRDQRLCVVKNTFLDDRQARNLGHLRGDCVRDRPEVAHRVLD